MSAAMATVQAFYEAFGRGDLKALRGVLDPRFTFRGPLMAFDNPDDYVRAMGQLPFQGTVEGSRFIADGSRVAHAFVFRMTAPVSAEIPMCEVLELADGRVRSSELFYDSRLFPAPPGA